MNKVKIMLLSLSLFAIVGAALAWKAKSITEFCTTTEYVVGIKTTCPALVTSTTSTQGNTFYTTTPNLNHETKCSYFDEISGEDLPITCKTYTTVVPD